MEKCEVGNNEPLRREVPEAVESKYRVEMGCNTEQTETGNRRDRSSIRAQRRLTIQRGKSRLQAIIDDRHEVAESYMRRIEARHIHGSRRTFWNGAGE
ncbi:hypothetical protein AGABI2DRAFT_190812 [Agaricus bisporus var. bisporus H97]|uniref:hypothetical protein n=1 Tax=Agaricus bisporus var. bisporus (strain H97 / ATCC MYA-4626 / FGSC 10389) TaxID=936046 RepID=UPI00029F74F2|nr:hypothetical protein AGABI2DRAFT_190812 [Agaricus bisporus var. bisporus H97]EKV50491.1 hypothetical protein AGABI2DRAFT_190812 [Agaricus bisporus var. bisporus H97]